MHDRDVDRSSLEQLDELPAAVTSMPWMPRVADTHPAPAGKILWIEAMFSLASGRENH